MLGAAMVFIDNGILRDSVVCGLGALFGACFAFDVEPYGALAAAEGFAFAGVTAYGWVSMLRAGLVGE